MLNALCELAHYRHLLRQLVILHLKVRYKNSVLGFLWTPQHRYPKIPALCPVCSPTLELLFKLSDDVHR